MRRPGSCVGRHVAAPGHPERGDLRIGEALALEQREQLQLLRVGCGEPGLDQIEAELVQHQGEADLLGRRERHALALHAIAQGGLVQLDRHAVDRAATGTGVKPVAVARIAAVQRVVERALHRARDLARLAGADRVVVDLTHRHQLGRRAGHVDLVGEVELGAREVALDDGEAEVAGDRDRRLAVDPVEDRRGLRRRVDDALADDEEVLARSLAHVAVRVEQDRLLVAGLVRLDLRQHRVEVLAAGLGVRDQPVGPDPPPRGDLGADAVLLARLAQVGRPFPDGDRDVDLGVEREQAHRAVAAEGDRADVALAHPVAGDRLQLRGGDLLAREGDRHVVELGRLEQAVGVLGVAEDRRPDLGVVTADALEDAGAVVQAVRQYVNLGLIPGDELPVHPDEI